MKWHRHVWEIRETKELPSAVDLAKAAGLELTMDNAPSYELCAVLEKPVLVTYRCQVCGTEKVERA